MKLYRVSLMAVALGGLMACATVATAQDNTGKEATPGGGAGGHRGPGMTVDQRLERMSKELNLTDDQKPKVKAVMQEQADKMKGLSPEERRDKMRESREEIDKKFKDILTDEQYKKWKTMGPGGHPGGSGAPEHKPADK